MKTTDWDQALKPLIKKYKGHPFPLEYKNYYQLVVMIVLAGQSTDKAVNEIAKPLFKTFPNFKALSSANEGELFPLISKIRNFRNKSKWLTALAGMIKTEKNIPSTMEELVSLPGIGRKSANVIMREMGVKAEGVIVDLHVVRVAPRLGIAKGSDPKEIEKMIMEKISAKNWGEAGMAISFLGRDTCRPKDPHHHECVMKEHCEYFTDLKKLSKGKLKKSK